MKRESVGFFDRALKIANEYYLVANELNQRLEDFDFNYTNPCVTNTMLAIELYLKALRMHENNNRFYKGHDLYELYHMLSKKIQDTIVLNFPDEVSVAKIDTFLNTHNKYFESWRYDFELISSPKTYDWSMSNGFLHALYATTNNLGK